MGVERRPEYGREPTAGPDVVRDPEVFLFVEARKERTGRDTEAAEHDDGDADRRSGEAGFRSRDRLDGSDRGARTEEDASRGRIPVRQTGGRHVAPLTWRSLADRQEVCVVAEFAGHENARRNRRSLDAPVNASTDRL